MTNHSTKNQINETSAPANFATLTDTQISTMTLLMIKLDHFINKLHKDFDVRLRLRQNGRDISVHGTFCFDGRLKVNQFILLENQGHQALKESFFNLEKFFNALGLKVAQQANVSLGDISNTIQKAIDSCEGEISFEDMGYVDVEFNPMQIFVPEDFTLLDQHPVGIAKTTYVLSRGIKRFHAIVDSEANTFQFNEIFSMQPHPSLEHLPFIFGSIKHIEHLSACGLSAEAEKILYHSGYKVHCVEVIYSDHPAGRKNTAFKDYQATIAHPTTHEISQINIIPNVRVNYQAINIKKYSDLTRLKGQLLACDKKAVDAYVKAHLDGYIFKSSQLKTSKKNQICSRMGIKKIQFELNQYPCRSIADDEMYCGAFANSTVQVTIDLAKGGINMKIENKNGEPDESKQAQFLKKSFLMFSNRFENKNSAELRYLISRILNDLYAYSNLYMY